MQNQKTFDNEITLLKMQVTGKDKYGNQIKEYTQKTILCNELSVQRSEFYLAGTNGLRASYVVSINAFEYDNEEKALYKDQEFYIIRGFLNGNLIELTLGDKHGS